MKQTVTINLAGIVYHIDNDAYETLNAYLKSIEEHLGASDSKAEIMQDIEARIAELFSQHMKFGHVEVVNIHMVNDIIEQLGSPEMITDGEEAPEAEETKAETAAEPQAAKPLLKRKFYRDTDHQTIGGVCAGFAQFIGIDAVWVRLAMAILFFLQGIGLLCYLLLWLIVPAANTAARRLEMRGIEPSAENIKAEVERLRENVDENGNLKIKNNQSGAWGCLKALIIAIAVICCAPFIVAIVAVIFALLAGGFGALVGAAPLAGLLGITTGAGTYIAIASISGLIFMLTPIVVLIAWAIHRNRTNEPMAKSFWITALIIWILSLSVTIFSGLKIGQSWELEDSNFEEKMESLGERLESYFEGLDENAVVVVNGDTISIKEAMEEAELDGSIESLDSEFGEGASEGILEVTEE